MDARVKPAHDGLCDQSIWTDFVCRIARAVDCGYGLRAGALGVPGTVAMMKDGSLVSWVWFGLAILLFAIEALRPGKFALWLGFAAILVAIVASVARWPWPAELAAFVLFALVTIPAWRRYERKA